MTLLLTRQQMLDDLFAESRTQLLTVTKDPARYEKFMSDSILQVLHTLIRAGGSFNQESTNAPFCFLKLPSNYQLLL